MITIEAGANPITITESLLLEMLPEAAIAIRRTLASDPTKGWALKAAEALLRHLPVPTAAGTRRLLEAPMRAEEASSSTQVVIGLHVDTSGHVAVGHVVGTVAPTLPARKE